MSRGRARRFTSFLLAVALIGSVVVGIAISAQALPEEKCAPNGSDADRFCVVADLTVSSTSAAAPIDADLTAENTSPQVMSNTQTWVDTLSLQFLGTTTSPLGFKPSTQMPDNLLVAGGGACSEPNYANCSAGNGTILSNVTGTPLGIYDGIRTGTFGVVKIVNVNPPTSGNILELEVTIDYCFTLLISCDLGGQETFPVMISDTGGSTASGPFSIPMSYPLQFSINNPITGVPTNVNADSALKEVSLHFEGTSNTLEDNTTVPEVKILTLPARCGTASGAAELESRADRVVTFTRDFTVEDCPTASASHTISRFTANFDGSASSSPVGGRTIAKWRWNWGDGSPVQQTLVPNASHRYKTGATRTVTLSVVDDEGAISDPIQKVVNGSVTRLRKKKLATRIRAFGRVIPAHAGRQVSVRLLRKRAGKFRLVKAKRLTLNLASKYSTFFKRPRRGACRLRAQFMGHSDHLASFKVTNFRC